MSAASLMLSKKGVKFAKQYLDPPAEGCGFKCEAGHPAPCAHYKNGPCSVELKSLIKAYSARSVSCAGELMAYGLAPGGA